MRKIAVLAGLAALPSALTAQDRVALDTKVYLERPLDGANLSLSRAGTLAPGDRVITVLRWENPRAGSYTLTSAVPARLRLQDASTNAIEASTDGGKRWVRLGSLEGRIGDVTHLRWRTGLGLDRLSYRAVVRR